LRRLLVQGRDPGRHLGRRRRRQRPLLPVVRGGRHRVADRLLHDPPGLAGLLRRRAVAGEAAPRSPRVAEGDDDPAGGARRAELRRRGAQHPEGRVQEPDRMAARRRAGEPARGPLLRAGLHAVDHRRDPRRHRDPDRRPHLQPGPAQRTGSDAGPPRRPRPLLRPGLGHRPGDLLVRRQARSGAGRRPRPARRPGGDRRRRQRRGGGFRRRGPGGAEGTDGVRPQLRPHPAVGGDHRPVHLPDPGNRLMAFPYATALLVVPAVGAAVSAAVPERKADAVRAVAVAFSLATLGLSVALLVAFHKGMAGYQFVESKSWIGALGVHYLMGVDGISLFMVVLTGLLFPIALLASPPITKRVNAYFALMLALEAALMGIFLAVDLFLFFVFWEAMLVPMYFLIGIWGHD